MIERNNQEGIMNGEFDLKNGIGYLLILSGLVAAFGELLGIYFLFVGPQRLVAFRQLFPEQLMITWAGEAIAIPSEVLVYSVPMILLLIAGGIISGLINAGVKLLISQREGA